MPTKALSLEIPQSVMDEHEDLHSTLARLAQESGPIGAAARDVTVLLRRHFIREEEYALPPLSLLPALAGGRVTPDMKPMIARTRRLKADLPRLGEEHLAIVAALRTLMDEGNDMDRPEVAAFARQLMLRARHEEDVLYPAAILVGEYLACFYRM